MNILKIFENYGLITAICGWFVAQFIKVVIELVKTKKIDFGKFISSGGMPSSHTSFVVSLATYVGLSEGFDTVAFAIAFVLAFVTMYDAAGVRRAAGKQAKVLNQIMDDMEEADDSDETYGQRLKELLGHNPIEVLAGAVLGIIVANISYFCFFI